MINPGMDSIQHRVSQLCWSTAGHEMRSHRRTMQLGKSEQKPDTRQTSLHSNTGAVWQVESFSHFLHVYSFLWNIFIRGPHVLLVWIIYRALYRCCCSGGSHAQRLSISEDALRCNCCITDFPTPLKKHFISVSQPYRILLIEVCITRSLYAF